MTLRRHKIIVSDNCWHQAVVRPDGQWVRYSDAEREIASLRAQLAEAEARAIRVGEAVRDFYAKDLDASATQHMHPGSLYAEYLREKARAIRALDVSDIANEVK